MGNNEEWEEIRKSVEDAEKKRFERYNGIDITENLKKVESKSKSLNKILHMLWVIILRILQVSIIAFIAFKLLTFMYIGLSNFKNAHDVDIVKTIETTFNAKVKVISKEIDDNENGEYYFELKKVPEIKFKGIKNFGSEKNDLRDNYQKYIFNNWDNSIKNEFLVDENRDKDGLLDYSNYLLISNFIDLENATNSLIEFLEYADNWDKENGIHYQWWKKDEEISCPIEIYLKLGNDVIYPYHSWFVTADEIREEAKKLYVELVERTNRDISDIPTDVLEKFN